VRVVVDTNVLISATLVYTSTSRRAFEKVIGAHTLLRSEETLAELIRSIYKPKFDKYFSKNITIRPELVLSYLEAAKQIAIEQRLLICRDPKDNKYLELALSGRADVIITGDKDLLILHPFREIPIITPSQFLNDY
jgi:putative PIN family toxin of toxin-antitoxin system